MSFFRLCFYLLICALLTIGCDKSGKKAQSQTTKEIRTNFIYNPLTTDPRKSTDPISNALHFMLYEGLTHLEPDGSVSLAIADSIDISNNRRIYTFYLKKTYWSNGTPLTAYDFERSWKALLSPEFPSLASHLLFPIRNAKNAKEGLCSLKDIGVQALDSYTLVVELEQPTPYFIELTAFATYFPVPNQGQEITLPKKGAYSLISNGPFVLTSWKNEDEITVQKNSYFWNTQSVKIDLIQITIISDERTTLQLFEKGNLDWIGGLTSPLPLDAIPPLNKAKKIKMRSIAGTNFCAFNTKYKPFNNVHIRKAFAYAINRKIIIDNVTQMFDEVATGLVPPVLKNYQENQFFIDNNIEESRKEFEIGLKELGWQKKDFPRLTYSYFSSELQKKLALSLQSQWSQVLGVEIQLESKELKFFLNQLQNRDYAFAQMSWVAQFHDRMSFLERFMYENTFRNYSAWEKPTYQELLSQSLTAISMDKREQILEKAEKILIEEMPIAPLYHYNVLYLKSPKLKNVQISPIGHVDFRYSDIY